MGKKKTVWSMEAYESNIRQLACSTPASRLKKAFLTDIRNRNIAFSGSHDKDGPFIKRLLDFLDGK